MTTNNPTTVVTAATAIKFLSEYPDANVQACAVVINETFKRKARIIDLVQEALSQVRLDVKYIVFDLDCTRKERDEAYAKLSNGPFEEGK
jgi:hypothetical protein